MKFINRIIIKYFRSIYQVDFKDISETLTIFTGPNDVGKSNVLRALNLFFNDQTDVAEDILFERDFSKIRKEEIQKKIKTRQLIQISLELLTPQAYQSLPKTFWVSRNFDRYDNGTDFIFEKKINNDKKKLAVASRFLHSLSFTYIPAVKDNDTFQDVLHALKSHLPPLQNDLLQTFNEELTVYGKELKEDFMNKINLTPLLSLPSTTKELFSSLDFSIQDNIVKTPLAQRGDGIRCRFIPSIMNYIAQNSSKRHIWAIEEPENSLEFSKALELAQTLEKEYSKNAQIFVTSHSPAFVGSIEQDSNKTIYYLEKDKNGKMVSERIDRDLLQDEQKLQLSQKLGYISLQRDLAECLHKKIEEAEKQKQYYEVLTKQVNQERNLVFVEGKTDEKYLRRAMEIFNISGFNIYWIGIKKDGQDTFCGETSLTKTFQTLEANPQLSINKKIVLLYDFDSRKKDKNLNNIYIRSTTKNNTETIYTKGIENLLNLSNEFDRTPFYRTVTKTGHYGEQNETTTFEKTKLCDHLCSLEKEKLLSIFVNFKTELEKLKAIFQND